MKTKTNNMAQFTILFGLLVSGVVVLTDEQVDGIVQILLSGANPGGIPVPVPSYTGTDAPDIIAGYDALAAFLGYSVPTCVKMSKEGRFDAAVLDFGGTRKKMWDRNKLIEIARKKK